MSEEIVKAKAEDAKQGGNFNVDDEHIRNISNNIKRSRFVWAMYLWMKTLLWFEGWAWLLLDTLRAARMKMAERISSYKQNDRV